jgi:hypothetical protein
MSADYYFRMGSTHSICQDYALAGESNGVAYAILSDGCSGIPKPEQPGSPYTDFGARFLVISAMRNLAAVADCRYPLTKIIADADAMRRQASLPSDSLDATLLMVTEKNGIISNTITGDGVLVYRNRDGSVHYTRRQFDGGAPAYLNYQVKTSAIDSYLEKSKTWTEFFGTKIDTGYTEESSIFDNSTIHSSYGRFSLSRDETDLILIFSDGIESFINTKTNQPVPIGDVLDVILDMPRMNGEFITRSCNYLLKRHCAEFGWIHKDDFSCAGIYMP